MISCSNFQKILIQLFLTPCKIETQTFYPSYSVEIKDFLWCIDNDYIESIYSSASLPNGRCILWYEEPLNYNDLEDLSNVALLNNHKLNVPRENICGWPTDFLSLGISAPLIDVNINLFANSEKSLLKKQWCKKNNFFDWYFFYHGFAALDWFRDYLYLKNDKFQKIDKVFISLNHLLGKKRSYRLHLLSLFEERNLLSKGIVSAPKLTNKIVKEELYSSTSPLSLDAKKHIYKNLHNKTEPKIIDFVDAGTQSASIPGYAYRALWHLVTETVFFDKALHLTEKIFKPIVIRRPFILCAAPGNLKYLQSYGFKTFSTWIDESYDDEFDNDRRLLMIINEIEKLCKMSEFQLNNMYNEMLPILEYNFNHFYTNFKTIIVNEMVDNFKICLKQYNLGLYTDRYLFPTNLFDENRIKEVLLN